MSEPIASAVISTRATIAMVSRVESFIVPLILFTTASATLRVAVSGAVCGLML
jgi:hypothetical protein